MLWLRAGLHGDDTDGHIDNLARFFSPEGILIAETMDELQIQIASVEENHARLCDFRTSAGDPYDVVPLPLPDDHPGCEPLAASYRNFIVLNGAVLVPTYRQPEKDCQRWQYWGSASRGLRSTGFDCTDIVKGAHCICIGQHQPAGSAKRYIVSGAEFPEAQVPSSKQFGCGRESQPAGPDGSIVDHYFIRVVEGAVGAGQLVEISAEK